MSSRYLKAKDLYLRTTLQQPTVIKPINIERGPSTPQMSVDSYFYINDGTVCDFCFMNACLNSSATIQFSLGPCGLRNYSYSGVAGPASY